MPYNKARNDKIDLHVNIFKYRHIGKNNSRDHGVIITNDLKWEAHVSYVVKKAKKLIYWWQKTFTLRSPNFIKNMFLFMNMVTRYNLFLLILAN